MKRKKEKIIGIYAYAYTFNNRHMKISSTMEVVPLENIYFISSKISLHCNDINSIYKEYSRIYLNDGTSRVKRCSLKQLETIDSFIRANKFELFNKFTFNHFKFPNVIIYEEKIKIHVSKTYKDAVLKKLNKTYM